MSESIIVSIKNIERMKQMKILTLDISYGALIHFASKYNNQPGSQRKRRKVGLSENAKKLNWYSEEIEKKIENVSIAIVNPLSADALITINSDVPVSKGKSLISKWENA